MLHKRSGRYPKLLVALTAVDLAVMVVLVAGCTLAIAVSAIVLHVALTAVAWCALPAGTRRTLAVAWMVSLPGLGFLVSLSTIGTRGEGDLQQFDRGQAPVRAVGPNSVVRALAGHVPMCERLVSGVSHVRRAALAGLVARNDAEAIEILRWAVRDVDGDLAIDAALTLEELNDGFEKGRDETRQQFADAPTFESAVAAGDLVLAALSSRLIADAMAATLAAEVQDHYDWAITHDGERSALLTERRVRLALLRLRPNDALELLGAAPFAPGLSAVLLPLYNQAIIASRRLSTSSRGA